MIKVLEKNIADKIAAGEVIDRPVSIVKELVENSIDAGADSITVEIKDGGKSYIRVTDNGCGIPSDQAEIAFLRHATSKIKEVADLDSINTLGFRGEALASICAVSHVELISKSADSKTGCHVIVEGSRIMDNTTCGCPDGTTITVRDLFFNLPARNKFMNSAAAESRKIIDFASRIALSYPDVRFNVINGKSTVFTTPGKGNIFNNIVSIYGTDASKNLIPVDMKRDEFRLKGFVSGPGTSLSSRNRQIFCVNGRIISSAVMEHALDKAYKERLFTGRFPLAFLFLTMSPEKLDVNIHPAKREIRFDDNSEVEDFVALAVKQALMSNEAIPEVTADITQQFKNTDTVLNSDREAESVKTFKENQFVYSSKEKNCESEQVDIKSILTTLRKSEDNIDTSTDDYKIDLPPAQRPFEFDELNLIGSIFDTYIICMYEDNMYLIDQHAAHERIFYERLKSQYESESKASQQLMLPLNFNVSSDVSSTESNWINAVRTMGYDIDFFGNNTYIIREIPAFMEMKEAEDFLRDLFSQFAEKPDLTESATMDRIIMRSCKSAVKAGDHLTDEEINGLINQLSFCDNPYSCPHGRPTFIKITKYEIEKMFKRV